MRKGKIIQFQINNDDDILILTDREELFINTNGATNPKWRPYILPERAPPMMKDPFNQEEDPASPRKYYEK